MWKHDDWLAEGRIWKDVPCSFGGRGSSTSNALKPSLPISPQTHPHSTIALARMLNPSLTAVALLSSNSFSLAASCASHACNSAWAMESLEFPTLRLKGRELKSDLRETEERAASTEIIESRLGFDDLDALMRRATLYYLAYELLFNYNRCRETYRISLSRMIVPTLSSISFNSLSLSRQASTLATYLLSASSAPLSVPATAMMALLAGGAEAAA